MLMPRRYNELPNDVLISMAISGDQEAREERLIREIMCVDGVTWDSALPTFKEMVTENRRFLVTISLC